MTKCAHDSVRWFHPATKFAKCETCGATLSLGPSNDKPLEVETEIDAASYATINLEDGSWMGRLSGYRIGYNGWLGHASAADIPLAGEAGWLAREMSQAAFLETHNLDHDPASWSWDPSRPIADQLAETARNDEMADAMIAAIAPDLHRIARGESTGAEVIDLDRIEYEVTRSAEPDCRDEDDPPLVASPEVCACTGDALLSERCEVES